jgi:ABC-type Zn uptake system ZnuABC Zn-binding protein ZnuA
MEDFLKNVKTSAQDAAEKLGETLSELKDAATEKFADLSAKAEALAAEEKAEAAEKLAEATAAKAKIDAHEGGALGFLSDKANELLGAVKDQASDIVDEGKDFWEKAKDYVSGDKKEESKD